MIPRSLPSRVPALRFPGYEDNWESHTLEFAATKIQDGTHFSPQVLEEGNYRYITSKNIRNGHMRLVDTQFLSDDEHRNIYKRCDVKYGDVLITKDGASTGNVCLNDIKEEISLLSSVAFIRANEDVTTNEYIYQYLSTPLGQKEVLSVISGQAITRITLTKLRNFKFRFPTLPEQQKIATFLSAVDKKIQLLQRKKELLEQYKKGVMQKLFSQEIRFKDEDGNDYPDWDVVSMEVVFGRVKRKNAENNQNVLTISAQQGLVNQKEYFNKSVAASDVTGYYLLKRNDFAYNKSYSKGYPMGAIKKLSKYDKGVVSTLYICFSIKSDDDSIFYERYLDNGGINHELHKIAQEGARNHGLLNLSVIEFFRDIRIPRPSVAEQKRIGQFLSILSKKVEAATMRLTNMQEFKKGLLQQMFV